MQNQRAAAAIVLNTVIADRRSLTESFVIHEDIVSPFVKEISYGVLRFLPRLEFFADKLLKRPVKEKSCIAHILILVGIYQLEYINEPDYAVVKETVSGCAHIDVLWAKDLTNAILRNFLRKREDLYLKADKDLSAKYSHPKWWITKIKKAWPEQWKDILIANNQRPPLSLRVNQQKTNRDDYQQLLEQSTTNYSFVETAITLDVPVNVSELNKFNDGYASVQDVAAQTISNYLPELKPGMKVLDMCCAPGGKLCHLLEIQPELKLLGLDIEDYRLDRVIENLERLNLSAEIKCADAMEPDDWWDGELFDFIILDAPCSASGVIRRHPDIKILRQPDDFMNLPEVQLELLQIAYSLLKPSGQLLYVTCSVMPEENEKVIKRFLQIESDAKTSLPDNSYAINLEHGQQILPGTHNMDGFYFCYY